MSSNGHQLEPLRVDEAVSALREGKRSSASELIALVRSMTPRFSSRLEALHALADQEGFRIVAERNPHSDTVLISAALLSVVLSDVYPLSPLKAEQLSTIEAACREIGIGYRDVLEMTTCEGKVLAALGA